MTWYYNISSKILFTRNLMLCCKQKILITRRNRRQHLFKMPYFFKFFHRNIKKWTKIFSLALDCTINLVEGLYNNILLNIEVLELWWVFAIEFFCFTIFLLFEHSAYKRLPSYLGNKLGNKLLPSIRHEFILWIS